MGDGRNLCRKPIRAALTEARRIGFRPRSSWARQRRVDLAGHGRGWRKYYRGMGGPRRALPRQSARGREATAGRAMPGSAEKRASGAPADAALPSHAAAVELGRGGRVNWRGIKVRRGEATAGPPWMMRLTTRPTCEKVPQC